ncbi:LOW QUALITY PROTEIN: hypothetical protein TorRG33x02_230750 [Trema orientale]|uniref:Uncharacterized protein n=1 Tax=Trema orientale TaxID=63057 RepID=A0A2P5E6H0_TREOI|nr:LOW QUALITY PROTEIN: hypothetical protein TorRG33x02_230750 [Trema orientale]
MDPEEIAKLYECLILTAMKVLKMNLEMYEDDKEKMELFLVGRIFGNKFVNREGLNEVVEQVWCTTCKVKVESMGVTNFFMFILGAKQIIKECCQEVLGYLATN